LNGAISQLRLGLIQDATQLFIFPSLGYQQFQKIGTAESAQFPFCHGGSSFRKFLARFQAF
jgi:hypothetical protein